MLFYPLFVEMKLNLSPISFALNYHPPIYFLSPSFHHPPPVCLLAFSTNNQSSSITRNENGNVATKKRMWWLPNFKVALYSHPPPPQLTIVIINFRAMTVQIEKFYFLECFAYLSAILGHYIFFGPQNWEILLSNPPFKMRAKMLFLKEEATAKMTRNSLRA